MNDKKNKKIYWHILYIFLYILFFFLSLFISILSGFFFPLFISNPIKYWYIILLLFLVTTLFAFNYLFLKKIMHSVLNIVISFFCTFIPFFFMTVVTIEFLRLL